MFDYFCLSVPAHRAAFRDTCIEGDTYIMLQYVILALPVCVQVSVFGYGADEQGNWHHYWEENRYAGAFRKTGVHSAEFETQVIHQLAKEGKISLHL